MGWGVNEEVHFLNCVMIEKLGRDGWGEEVERVVEGGIHTKEHLK